MKYRSSLKVTETDEAFVYLVASHAGQTDYLVSLTERITEDGRAHGACQCIWFQTNANPNLERYARRIPYAVVLGNVRDSATECKHIAAARAYYDHHVTLPMLGQLNAGIPH